MCDLVSLYDIISSITYYQTKYIYSRHGNWRSRGGSINRICSCWCWSSTRGCRGGYRMWRTKCNDHRQQWDASNHHRQQWDASNHHRHQWDASKLRWPQFSRRHQLLPTMLDLPTSSLHHGFKNCILTCSTGLDLSLLGTFCLAFATIWCIILVPIRNGDYFEDKIFSLFSLFENRCILIFWYCWNLLPWV